MTAARAALMERESRPTRPAPGDRLRVAVIDEELPYPLDSGKRIRTFELLRRLAPRHDVTILAHEHADAGETRSAEAALRAAGIAVRLVSRALAAKQGPGFYLRLLANLASSRPYSVDANCTRSLRGGLKQLAREDFDLWHFEWTPLAALGEEVAERPRVVVAHNIETLIWQRYAALERHPLKRRYIAEQARKFERFERHVLRSADRVVTVSGPDADLARRFGAQEPAVVDNGVDIARFEYRRPAGDANTVLFLGSLDWRPNQDAVGWLLESIWPEIRRQRPAATLSIVGRRPPRWLVDRSREADGVRLATDVPDVRPYLGAAAALIVPLRVGGGSRLKILEALAAGVPVVSTRVGAEGLHLVPGEHALLAEEPGALATAALRLLADEPLRKQLAAAGRQLVEARYDWDRLAERLESVWQETARCRRS